MARKKKGKVVVGEKSPEYLNFETFARKVLSVPKEEIDRRQTEEQQLRAEPKPPDV